MYLQITTKCNMKCDHCCYSCTMRGKHMTWDTFIDAVSFIREWDDTISIGGGEPTLHPRFFDILRICLNDFSYVWFATNGSQTGIMMRLANIIDGEDFIEDYECTCDPEDLENGYDCECWQNAQNDGIYQENKLSVALSQDCFHDPIDQRVVDLWTKRSNRHGPSHFEIRNVKNIIAQGRAKKTGVGWNEEDCVCSDIIIKPNGKLRLCGCNNAPIIGDIWQGVKEKWRDVLNDDIFREADCYNYWKNKRR